MRVLFKPQRSDKDLKYEFKDKIIVAVYEGQSDEFDFSHVTDGRMIKCETQLPINPIISAKCENGEFFVELLNFYGKQATQEELFPQWQVID